MQTMTIVEWFFRYAQMAWIQVLTLVQVSQILNMLRDQIIFPKVLTSLGGATVVKMGWLHHLAFQDTCTSMSYPALFNLFGNHIQLALFITFLEASSFTWLCIGHFGCHNKFINFACWTMTLPTLTLKWGRKEKLLFCIISLRICTVCLHGWFFILQKRWLTGLPWPNEKGQQLVLSRPYISVCSFELNKTLEHDIRIP